MSTSRIPVRGPSPGSGDGVAKVAFLPEGDDAGDNAAVAFPVAKVKAAVGVGMQKPSPATMRKNDRQKAAKGDSDALLVFTGNQARLARESRRRATAVALDSSMTEEVEESANGGSGTGVGTPPPLRPRPPWP